MGHFSWKYYGIITINYLLPLSSFSSDYVFTFSVCVCLTPLSRSKGQRSTCSGRGHIVVASPTACCELFLRGGMSY